LAWFVGEQGAELLSVLFSAEGDDALVNVEALEALPEVRE
jgi:hypothetical protein